MPAINLRPLFSLFMFDAIAFSFLLLLRGRYYIDESLVQKVV